MSGGWISRRRARRPVSPGAGMWKPFPVESSAAEVSSVNDNITSPPAKKPQPFDFVVRPLKRRRPESAAPTPPEESVTRWREQSGTAILCLPPDNDGAATAASWFCGHFLFSRAGSRAAQGQIVATELPCDGCAGCAGGDARRFALELAVAGGGDAAAARRPRATAEVVRTGGDMARLRWIARADDRGDRTRVEFDPEAMHADARAARLIREYFPNVARDATETELRECVVCVGRMRLENVEFRRLGDVALRAGAGAGS